MNKIMILIILILFPVIALAQSVGGNNIFRANDGELVKTYTTYTAASDDTTGWLTIGDPVIGSRPLAAKRLVAIWLSTDSACADVYFIGKNTTYTTVTTNSLVVGNPITGVSSTTYVDSLPIPGNKAFTGTLPYFRAIPLIGDGFNRLPGCTTFKIGTVFRADGQGTTAGRTGKWYLQWVR